MKRFSLVAAALLALGLAASAQTLSRDTFNISAGGGGSAGSSNSYFVIGAKSVYGGAPLVTYVDATSDLTTSVIQCYRVGYVMRATVTNSTTTVYVDAVPSGATNAGIIVIRHLADDSYERLAVTSTSSSTNLTTTVAGDYDRAGRLRVLHADQREDPGRQHQQSRERRRHFCRAEGSAAVDRGQRHERLHLERRAGPLRTLNPLNRAGFASAAGPALCPPETT